jgi:hypothetical protein
VIAPRLVMIAASFLLSATLAAQAPQPTPAETSRPLAPLKIGTRVGLPQNSGYDDGGRRDPFASLIVEKAPSVATSGDSMEARAKGLAGIAVVDAAVKGIITSGSEWLAIIAGPNGAQFLAHANDKLHDGSVRRIERESVVFIARAADVTGKIVAREVRKGIRATAGGAR